MYSCRVAGLQRVHARLQGHRPVAWTCRVAGLQACSVCIHGCRVAGLQRVAVPLEQRARECLEGGGGKAAPAPFEVSRAVTHVQPGWPKPHHPQLWAEAGARASASHCALGGSAALPECRAPPRAHRASPRRQASVASCGAFKKPLSTCVSCPHAQSSHWTRAASTSRLRNSWSPTCAGVRVRAWVRVRCLGVHRLGLGSISGLGFGLGFGLGLGSGSGSGWRCPMSPTCTYAPQSPQATKTPVG